MNKNNFYKAKRKQKEMAQKQTKGKIRRVS